MMNMHNTMIFADEFCWTFHLFRQGRVVMLWSIWNPGCKASASNCAPFILDFGGNHQLLDHNFNPTFQVNSMPDF